MVWWNDSKIMQFDATHNANIVEDHHLGYLGKLYGVEGIGMHLGLTGRSIIYTNDVV